MSKKIVISKVEIRGKTATSISLFHQFNPIEMQVIQDGKPGILGNIYVGKVKNIVENIKAAFIEIDNGVPCYFPLDKESNPIYTSPKKEKKLKIGDELLVQVQREALKAKVPCVTGNLGFTGKFLVLTTGDKSVGFSKKLGQEERCRLLKWIEPMMDSNYGFIIRTNAGEASKDEFMKEAIFLIQRYVNVTKIADYRPCFTLIEKAPSSYISTLRDTYGEEFDHIITDDPQIFKELQGYLSTYQKEDLDKLEFYEDKLLPLNKLYALESVLKEALSEKVWLKSGGYLIIQQTEAFVVIDVNTGKFTGKKKLQETYRKINHEAAVEIAHQIRLRNLSGIVLIDFINMDSHQHDEELMHVLQKYIRKDPIKTTVVDMTKLKIVELTRQKIKKTLEEQVNSLFLDNREE